MTNNISNKTNTTHDITSNIELDWESVKLDPFAEVGSASWKKGAYLQACDSSVEQVSELIRMNHPNMNLDFLRDPTLIMISRREEFQIELRLVNSRSYEFEADKRKAVHEVLTRFNAWSPRFKPEEVSSALMMAFNGESLSNIKLLLPKQHTRLLHGDDYNNSSEYVEKAMTRSYSNDVTRVVREHKDHNTIKTLATIKAYDGRRTPHQIGAGQLSSAINTISSWNDTAALLGRMAQQLEHQQQRIEELERTVTTSFSAEELELRQALNATSSKAAAARLLGIGRTTFYNRCKKYGIAL